MTRVHPAGIFEGPVPPGRRRYHLEADYGQPDQTSTFASTTRTGSWPTIGELDLHLFGEGRHRRLWEVLGAHPRVHDGIAGTAFAVWAPNAQAVRVVGDWNFWDGRVHPMRSLGSSGVWELFVPGVAAGARYKYELITADGPADPEDRSRWPSPPRPRRPRPASSPTRRRTSGATRTWMAEPGRDGPAGNGPMSVYEVHLGSWRWIHDDRRPAGGPSPTGSWPSSCPTTWPSWASPTSS